MKIALCSGSSILILLLCAHCADSSLKGRTIGASDAMPAASGMNSAVVPIGNTGSPQTAGSTTASDQVRSTATLTQTVTGTATATGTGSATSTISILTTATSTGTMTASGSVTGTATVVTTGTAVTGGASTSRYLPAGNGIAPTPVDLSSLTITGETLQQCNQNGKSWVPQFAGKTGSAGCEEALAPIACDPTDIAAYFKKLGIAFHYADFVAKTPGYVLYNCGLKDRMLILHWLSISANGLEYAAMGVAYL